jgi:hypothetical protein
MVDAGSISLYNKGHVSGAINVDWTRVLENRIFKNKEELSKIYSKIPSNAQIITYCQGGYRAANTFLALKIYLGSYNFPSPADVKNGENLLLIRDRRIEVSYMVEALRIFYHYHFRVNQLDPKKAQKELVLSKPPRSQREKAWWVEDYTNVRKIKDRQLFA